MFAEKNPAPGLFHQRSISGYRSSLLVVTPQRAGLRDQAATPGGLAPVSIPSHYY